MQTISQSSSSVSVGSIAQWRARNQSGKRLSSRSNSAASYSGRPVTSTSRCIVESAVMASANIASALDSSNTWCHGRSPRSVSSKKPRCRASARSSDLLSPALRSRLAMSTNGAVASRSGGASMTTRLSPSFVMRKYRRKLASLETGSRPRISNPAFRPAQSRASAARVSGDSGLWLGDLVDKIFLSDFAGAVPGRYPVFNARGVTPGDIPNDAGCFGQVGPIEVAGFGRGVDELIVVALQVVGKGGLGAPLGELHRDRAARAQDLPGQFAAQVAIACMRQVIQRLLQQAGAHRMSGRTNGPGKMPEHVRKKQSGIKGGRSQDILGRPASRLFGMMFEHPRHSQLQAAGIHESHEFAQQRIMDPG